MAIYKKQGTKTESIHDGYCIVSFKKKFLKQLQKDLEKQSNKDYELRQKYAKKNGGVFVIPPSYNSNAAKYRMKMEGALNGEGLVGIQINESDDFELDQYDYAVLEQKLLLSNADVMLFENYNEKIFICTNEEHNLEKVTDIIYVDVIKKREDLGIGLIKKDGFLLKEIGAEEQKFVEKTILNEISQGEYIGSQTLALNLLSTSEPTVKLILQDKHRKDIEKILTFLNISHMIFEDFLIVALKDINKVNRNIDDYIHGAIYVKDKQIYGLNTRVEIDNEKESVKTTEKETSRIDDVINKNKDKTKEIQRTNNTHEISK